MLHLQSTCSRLRGERRPGRTAGPPLLRLPTRPTVAVPSVAAMARSAASLVRQRRITYHTTLYRWYMRTSLSE